MRHRSWSDLVEIPKPDGGVRKLGVPCVVDRLIQQAVLQVLQERWDPTFSEHSYGFRIPRLPANVRKPFVLQRK